MRKQYTEAHARIAAYVLVVLVVLNTIYNTYETFTSNEWNGYAFC